MKLHSITTVEVEPSQIAEALANASPVEFAAFWLRFDQLTHDVRTDDANALDGFAYAMSNPTGLNRVRPLRRLLSLIDFYQERAKRREVL